MKFRKADILSKVHKIPELKFEDQKLSSFSGAIILQNLFQAIDLKEKIKRCFFHQKIQSIYGIHNIFILMIVHIFTGFKRIRGRDYYFDDPIIKRIVGMKTIPEVSTISRSLGNSEEQSVNNLRTLMKDLVVERISKEKINRLTMDFDGSVLSTCGHAEGSAIGFNKKKKGARSYYPLFCTIAQTSQFFDFHHRPGNVHDSNGADLFMESCFDYIRKNNSKIILESRLDSAFYNENIITILDDENIEFSASVPFERFPELKEKIMGRKKWGKIDNKWSYFENCWSPNSWANNFRIIITRQKVKKQEKGPLQLDLFAPKDHDFEYKVIVSNKKSSPKNILYFHNGRGAQEKIFAEAKSGANLKYIPFRKMISNKLFIMANMFAINLCKELQMGCGRRNKSTTMKRSPLWKFDSISKICHDIILRAGRLTSPQGKITLTLNSNRFVKNKLLQFLNYGT